MSYGLPPSTETIAILAKSLVIDKYELKGDDRKGFDDMIHRITICNEISPTTVNIPPGEIKSIFVLKVELRKEECSPNILRMLFNLIGQKIIMVLECGVMCRPVIFHEVLIGGGWRPVSDFSLSLNGLDLDGVWANLVIQVGCIEVAEGNTLSEQVLIDEEKRKRTEKIEQLRKKMMFEKQPRKKRELFEKIRKLEAESDGR